MSCNEKFGLKNTLLKGKYFIDKK